MFSSCKLLSVFVPIIVALWAVNGLVARSQTSPQPLREQSIQSDSTQSKQTFASSCAGCHGLDGRGGERAPNIAGSTKVQRLSDAQIASIISNGIPGTGMPAFHSLRPAQVRAVVSYLSILRGSLEARALPGDPDRGRKIFFGKGECSSCHGISGEGGFVGPDLTAYGSALSAKAIFDAILNPSRMGQSGYRAAAVTASDGSRVEGIVRNEDNFSVQLQAQDGSFHFFQKTGLRGPEYLGQSLMPTNYGERLSRTELNDLASYLMTTDSSPRAARASENQ